MFLPCVMSCARPEPVKYTTVKDIFQVRLCSVSWSRYWHSYNIVYHNHNFLPRLFILPYQIIFLIGSIRIWRIGYLMNSIWFWVMNHLHPYISFFFGSSKLQEHCENLSGYLSTYCSIWFQIYKKTHWLVCLFSKYAQKKKYW